MTGTGTTFSAGVDLSRLLDEGPDYAQAFVPVLTELFEIVFDFPKPVGRRSQAVVWTHLTERRRLQQAD